MNFQEKRVEGKVLFRGRQLTLEEDTVRLADGRLTTREVVRHAKGVCVAALTQQQELLFVRQFRYPYGGELLELPAGKVEPEEDVRQAARRELYEETGARDGSWQPMGSFWPSPGYTDEELLLFLARGVTLGESHPDDGELLEAVRIPLKEAVEQVMTGRITDGKTQTLVLRVARLYNV